MVDPTVNVTIDPHPCVTDQDPPEKEAHKEYNPARILEVIGVSFAAGMLVGGMLVFAFSRPTVCDA